MKTGVLECWSDGVMVKKKSSESCDGFAVPHYSITPVLQFSVGFDYKENRACP